MKIKKERNINLYAIIIGTILVLYTLSVFMPILWGLMTTLKERMDWAQPGSVLSFPDITFWELNKEYNQLHPGTFDNYDNIFGNYLLLASDLYIDGRSVNYFRGFNLDIYVSKAVNVNFIGFILNTLLYAGGTALFAAFAPCIMGYLCAKFRYKFCNFIYAFVLFVMVMPIVGNTTAMITLLRRLSLYDTIWGMWIKGFGFANTYFLIYHALFIGVSDTYSEAAQIDGASHFRIMWTIYIPLAAKTITTVYLLQFVSLYNDYNTSLVYIPSHLTLAYAVWHFSNDTSGNGNVPFNLAASMTLAMPMVILFAIFKKKLMGDISVGGIKE